MQAECAAHNHSEVVSVPEAYKVQIIEPWPWTQMLLAAVLFLRMKRLLTGKHGSCKSLTESTVSLCVHERFRVMLTPLRGTLHERSTLPRPFLLSTGTLQRT